MSSPLSASSPADSIKERPRASASSMGLRMSCESSFAREIELETFSHSFGLTYGDVIVREEGSERGNDIHRLLQAVPIRLPEHGFASDGDGTAPRLKGAKLGEFLDECIAGLNLDLDENAWWYALQAVEARDAMILDALDQAAPDGGGWVKIDALLDQKSIEMVIDIDGEPEPFRARPDVLVTLEDAAGNALIVLIDYKSGWQAERHTGSHAAQNATGLLIRADQLAREGKNVVGAFGATFTPGALRASRRAMKGEVLAEAPLSVDEYTPEALAELTSRAIEIQTSIHRLARRVRREMGADGEVPEDLQEELHDRAQPGSHCARCHGKACCTKLHVHLREKAADLGRPEWDAVRTLLKPLSSTSAAKRPKPEELPALFEKAAQTLGLMHPSQIATALLELTDARSTAKLIDQTGKALDHVTRATLKVNPEAVPGASLQTGKRTFVVKPDASGAEPTPQDVFAAVQAFLNQPEHIKRMGGRPLDLNGFVANFVSVDPVKFRRAVKVIGGFATDELAAQALADLPASPFQVGTQAPGVVIDPEAIDAAQKAAPAVAEDDQAADAVQPAPRTAALAA